MGIFGKKKADEFESLHNDNLFNDDDDIIIPAGKGRVGTHRIGQNSAYAPHALTANEVTNSRTEDIPMTSHPQPDSVYKRMKEREQQNVATAIEDDYVPSWATASASPAAVTAQAVMSSSTPIAEATPKQTHTEPAVEKTPAHSASTDAFLERCRIAVEKATQEESAPSSVRHTEIKPKAEDSAPIKAPESEESKPQKPTKPETRSVDDIIRMLRGESSDGRNEKPSSDGVVAAALDNSATDEASTAPVVDKPQEQPTAVVGQSVAPEVAETVEQQDGELKVEVEVIPTDSDSDIMHTTGGRHMGDEDVRIYGKIVRGAVIQHTPEGDVEASDFVRAPKISQDTIVADDKTVMFGDLGDMISQRADADLNSDQLYDQDDDFDDDEYFEDRPYYETTDPKLDGIDDYKDLNDAARLRTKLMTEKSKNKTVMLFTMATTVIMLAIALLPSGFLPNVTVAVINFILLFAATVMNYDIFSDFKNLANMRPKFDSCVAVASCVALLHGGISAFFMNGESMGFAAAVAVLLFCNRISRFMSSSRILRGLELIANSEEKRAIVSVGGNNAKVISSGAIDGESLVLCDRKAVNVKDYLKNCGYDSPIDRKIKVLLIASSAIALVIGIISGYFNGVPAGLSAASLVLCCLFPASAAFVCELPMYIASKKADKYGAMLAGYKGAYELNLANLVAVSSTDLFPEGSVKLYNMKTLGENEIGKTLIDAAAVAIAANSPLSAIFTEILGNTEGNTLPKVNGVQYEDKMGISGWIGERTILIGNRNLMQGHNISVPSASVDQKILKAGYFPVYIAVDGVPCLLFVVQYETDPEVTRELQVLCNTGMTVVVDPKDPNTTEAMICDYFGLPNDALKVMNHNGRVSYERTAAPTESASAPAAFGKNVCGFFSCVTSAIRLGGIYSLLTALFVIAAVLGIVLVAYLGISGKTSLINPLTLTGFQLLFAAISAIISKIKLS